MWITVDGLLKARSHKRRIPVNIPANLDKFDSIGEAYDYERSTDLDTLHDRYERGRYR